MSEEHIKRPSNAFFVYCKDKEDVRKTNRLAPKLNRPMLALSWANESPAVREDCYARALEIAAKHKEDYPDYKFSPVHKKDKKQKGKKRGMKKVKAVVSKEPEQDTQEGTSAPVPLIKVEESEDELAHIGPIRPKPSRLSIRTKPYAALHHRSLRMPRLPENSEPLPESIASQEAGMGSHSNLGLGSPLRAPLDYSWVHQYAPLEHLEPQLAPPDLTWNCGDNTTGLDYGATSNYYSGPVSLDRTSLSAALTWNALPEQSLQLASTCAVKTEPEQPEEHFFDDISTSILPPNGGGPGEPWMYYEALPQRERDASETTSLTTLVVCSSFLVIPEYQLTSLSLSGSAQRLHFYRHPDR
ncbi:hypothetical protein DXG01_016548 [Tephrocybe rancida]|nr:hypothetical protein DXG01_016548 [Tephrocybe rancida]